MSDTQQRNGAGESCRASQRLRRRWASLACVLLALVAACGESGGAGPELGGGEPPSNAFTVIIEAGDRQTATVGTRLASPLRARVADTRGRPRAGVTLSFRVVAGGGSVFAGAATSGVDGVVQEVWTLGTVARDTQRVEVRAVDPQTGEPRVYGVFTAVGTPGAPSILQVVTGNGQDGVNGDTLPIAPAVRVTDQYGNGMPGISIGWQAASGGQIFPLAPTSDSLGLVSVRWVLGEAGPQSLSAQAPGLAPVQFTARIASWRVAQVTTGARHACVLTREGKAYCWGANDFGQLGDGTTSGRSRPTPVAGSQSFRSIIAGFDNTCGITRNDIAFCWGRNDWGELGDGTRSARSTPQLLAGPWPGVRTIAMSQTHGCALSTVGAAYCWGANSGSATRPGTNARAGDAGAGMLGVGSVAEIVPRPLPVVGGRQFESLGVSDRFQTCGLVRDGQVYCWGWGYLGGLGVGDTVSRTVPTPIASGGRYIALRTSVHGGCALTATGQIDCWGANLLGLLGSGVMPSGGGDFDTNPTYRSLVPLRVANAAAFASIATGLPWVSQCALTAAGSLLCWGGNHIRQPGAPGGPTPSAVPVPFDYGIQLRAVSVGTQGTCGLSTGDVVMCWGANLAYFGNMSGVPTQFERPTNVPAP
jgi:alpha-tubulin suppressor-like RCC1 family protein